MAKAERAAVSASDSNLPAEPQTFEGPDRHSNTFEVVADRVGQPGGRVLLVDDEDIVRAGHGQVLTRAGWTVVAEGDARLAAQRLAVESFDVIVTDLVMPSMSGLDLLRTAREYDLDVPVVILTGRPDVQSAMEAMQYGAFRYIDKPVLPAMLVDVVGRARDLHMMARFKREALSVLDLPNRALGDPALFRRIARLESVRVGDSMRQIAKSPLAWPAEATHRPRCRAAAGARGNRMPTAGTRAPRDR
ncbi:MAG: response regulator, partial [Polyangiaceae bacterium]|jgi:CheY-like chemotaxis protein